MPKILDHLSKVTYQHRIIIGLDRADEAQFRHARKFFKGLNQNNIVIWNDSPRRTGQRRKRLVLFGLLDVLRKQCGHGDP